MVGQVSQTTISEHLHGLVQDSDDIQTFLTALTRLAVQNLSDGNEDVLCGVTLLRDGKVGTVASSSERARRMDEIQYEYSDGPCLHAARTNETVSMADLKDETRWPEYVKDVVHHGVRSVLAIPFILDRGASAGLNLYSEQPGKFDAESQQMAKEYAGQASQALQLSIRLAHHQETEADLKAAMESRTVIDLAVGIIMGQSRCSQDRAISMLKSASSSRNIKLRDLAAGIVESTGGTAASTHFDS